LHRTFSVTKRAATKAMSTKMDLQGVRESDNQLFRVLFSPGANRSAQGNLFTDLFGPQVKFRTPKVQPFAHLPFGSTHDAFASGLGGGIDVPLTS